MLSDINDVSEVSRLMRSEFPVISWEDVLLS